WATGSWPLLAGREPDADLTPHTAYSDPASFDGTLRGNATDSARHGGTVGRVERIDVPTARRCSVYLGRGGIKRDGTRAGGWLGNAPPTTRRPDSDYGLPSSSAVLAIATNADVAVHTRAGKVERALHLVLVFREHVNADDLGRLQIAAAMEVGRVVGAAAAVVDGGLRIRAQRPRPRDDAAARGLRADLRRRHSVFDPVDEGIEQVLRLRPAATAAVRDTRRAEQSIELLQAFEVGPFPRSLAEARGHLSVVVDHATRHDELVVAADEREQRAAVAPEHIEVAE